MHETNRRNFLAAASGVTAGLAARGLLAGRTFHGRVRKMQIAITLDLEMARNFPNWEDTHWDYEKGNLNDAAKAYAVEACRRVKQRGGVVHAFVVGRVLEQENVDWLKEIADDGHLDRQSHLRPRVCFWPRTPEEIQFRFARASG